MPEYLRRISKVSLGRTVNADKSRKIYLNEAIQ